MSRTTRHIPFDKRGIQPWEAAYVGLGEECYRISDPRDRLTNGYDNRRGQSWLHHAGEKYNDGDWRFSAKCRRYYKRWKRRTDRRKSLASIRNELEEHHAPET